MSRAFTLTKEEFISRSMKGEVFIHNSCRYFYDETEPEPFRLNDIPLVGAWNYFNGKTLFTLEEPEPIIERRWRWLLDASGYTKVSDSYYSDKKAVMLGETWYKNENDYIDVVVK